MMPYFKDFMSDFSKNRFLKLLTLGTIAHLILSIILYAITYIPTYAYIIIILSILKAVTFLIFASGLLLLSEYFENKIVFYNGVLNLILGILFLINGNPEWVYFPHVIYPITMFLIYTYLIIRMIQTILLFFTSLINAYVFLFLAQSEGINLFRLPGYAWILQTVLWIAAFTGFWLVYIPFSFISVALTIICFIVISADFEPLERVTKKGKPKRTPKQD